MVVGVDVVVAVVVAVVVDVVVVVVVVVFAPRLCLLTKYLPSSYLVLGCMFRFVSFRHQDPTKITKALSLSIW